MQGRENKRNKKNLRNYITVTNIVQCRCKGKYFSVFFSLLGKGGPFSNKVARSSDRFTFDDIFSGRFSPAGYSCQWVSGWYHFSVKSS